MISRIIIVFRLSKKEKEDRARRREEKQQELLMEWSEDEDGEAEEFKKIQVNVLPNSFIHSL